MNSHWQLYLLLISTLLSLGVFEWFFKSERPNSIQRNSSWKDSIGEEKGGRFLKVEQEDKVSQTNDSSTFLPEPPSPISFVGFVYRGTWKSNLHGPFEGYFSQMQGVVELLIETTKDQTGTQFYKLEARFRDGDYDDGKIARVSNMTMYPPNPCQNNYCNWTGVFYMFSRLIDEFSEDYTTTIPVSYSLSIKNYTNKDSSQISFSLNSTEVPESRLNVFGTTTPDTTDYQAKAIYYSLMITLVCLIKLYSVIRLIKFVTESEIEGGKISILAIGFAQTCDTYWCLFHLFRALENQDLFYYFITPTFWYFILCFIFDLRLIVMLWKIRYFHTYNNHTELRRGIIYFYVRLYFLMFGTLILLYFFILVNWLMVIFQMYLLPQIIHVAMKGQKPNLQPYFLFGFVGIRIVQPLYFRGCPHGLFELTPSLPFCILVVIFIALQILVVMLQSKCGSRFFIPSFCLPPKFKYIVDYIVESDQDLEFDDCVICMNGLYDEPNDNSAPLLLNHDENMVDNTEKSDLNPQKQGTRRKRVKKKIMRTPCGHRYHIPCLTRWMELKLECPTCRNPLPPLE